MNKPGKKGKRGLSERDLNEREVFIRVYQAENYGHIRALKHIMSLCRAVITAHPATRKEAERVADLNSHKWEQPDYKRLKAKAGRRKK